LKKPFGVIGANPHEFLGQEMMGQVEGDR